ncbi:MAG: alpha/beta fold hydrolase [Streptosporangiales bacterium]|nr:alpha/beta fold hydrolase [Streptosporangiales bacterium]
MSYGICDITGHYIDVDGTLTFYDELGDGPAIVCVHTAGASSLEYRYLLAELADRGYRAIALDLPGRGRTYPAGWEVTTRIHPHAEFVHRFTQLVCSGGRPVITGSSIGGDITLDIAAHHGEDYLAAIPMEGAARTPTFPDPSEYMYPSWTPGWQDLMERVSGASLNRACPAEKVEELRWMHRNAQVSAVGDLCGWANHDIRDVLPGTRCPVLVVKGADDFWLPEELVDETVKLLPDGEKLVLDGIGHYPMFEDPARIADVIVDFVQRVNSRAVGAAT